MMASATPRQVGGSLIHPTAAVEPGAQLDPSVEVGPYAVIGEEVQIGPGSRVGAHAVVVGDTRLGAETWVGPHAVLGGAPQIRGLEGRCGALRAGRGNVFRELCTVHLGQPGGVTHIGDGNLFMVGSHVAHDCRLGDGVELANGVQLAGHVEVGDQAGLGGLAAVHQFVRIGAHAFVGAGALVAQDVPPFSLAAGNRALIYGLNLVGLRRRGFPPATLRVLGRALRELLRAPVLQEALQRLEQELPTCESLTLLLAFARSSRRGLCRLAGGRPAREEA